MKSNLASPLRLVRHGLGFLWAGLMGLVLTAANEVSAQAPELPGLRVADVQASWDPVDSEVLVPVSLVQAQDANYIDLTLFYDDSFLSFVNVQMSAESGEWELSPEEGFREVSEGKLRGVFLRSRIDDEVSGEQGLFDIVFRVRGGARDEDSLFETSPILFQPLRPGQPGAGSDFSFVGHLVGDEKDGDITWQATTLESGSLTVYYGNFVEISSGEMTRREQNFTVPLYLSYFGDADMIRVGIDYDELILRGVHRSTRRQSGGDIKFETADDGSSSSFILRLRSAGEPRYYREHIADLEFYYDGQGDQADLRIHPSLDDGQDAHGGAKNDGDARDDGDAKDDSDARDDGGAAAVNESVSGIISFVEPQFVRGNIDSSMNVSEGAGRFSPNMFDAISILNALFLERAQLPCREAADIDDNGIIEMTDSILLLAHLFNGGDEPVGPYPMPGPDGINSEAHLGCGLPLPYFELSDN